MQLHRCNKLPYWQKKMEGREGKERDAKGSPKLPVALCNCKSVIAAIIKGGWEDSRRGLRALFAAAQVSHGQQTSHGLPTWQRWPSILLCLCLSNTLEQAARPYPIAVHDTQEAGQLRCKWLHLAIIYL